MTSYPVERYIDLENNPYLLGRVMINQVKDDFNAEVDIIHRESHKIFKHVGMIYGQHSAEEAIICGIQKLRQFLETVEKEQSSPSLSLVSDEDEQNYH
jgi:hypothetical protein